MSVQVFQSISQSLPEAAKLLDSNSRVIKSWSLDQAHVRHECFMHMLPISSQLSMWDNMRIWQYKHLYMHIHHFEWWISVTKDMITAGYRHHMDASDKS